MDGNVLTGKDQRCMPTNMSTIGDQMKGAGLATAMIGKYDAGYTAWACAPNCRGFDYWLGYYGAAEDYYQHGVAHSLDLHENYEYSPQYRGEYSTDLFSRKAVEIIGQEQHPVHLPVPGVPGRSLAHLAASAVLQRLRAHQGEDARDLLRDDAGGGLRQHKIFG